MSQLSGLPVIVLLTVALILLVQLHVGLSLAYPCNTLQGGCLGNWSLVHNC